MNDQRDNELMNDDDSASIEAEGMVAKGLATFSRMTKVNEEFKREIEKLRYAEKCQAVENEALNVRLSALGSEIESLRMERDALLRKNALYAGLLSSLKAQVVAFSEQTGTE